MKEKLYLFTKDMLRNKTLLFNVGDLLHGDISIESEGVLPDGYRAGGNVFVFDDKLFIPVQPSEVEFYGERLCIYEIKDDLSFTFFCEVNKPKNLKALHHLSNFNGEFFCDFIYKHLLL
jgi:hypothetical protein